MVDTFSIKSKKPHVIVFKLNSDDYSLSDIKKITKHIKSLGYYLTKSRSYSETKCMSIARFTLWTDSFKEVSFYWNSIISKKIVEDALSNKD